MFNENTVRRFTNEQWALRTQELFEPFRTNLLSLYFPRELLIQLHNDPLVDCWLDANLITANLSTLLPIGHFITQEELHIFVDMKLPQICDASRLQRATLVLAPIPSENYSELGEAGLRFSYIFPCPEEIWHVQHSTESYLNFILFFYLASTVLYSTVQRISLLSIYLRFPMISELIWAQWHVNVLYWNAVTKTTWTRREHAEWWTHQVNSCYSTCP